ALASLLPSDTTALVSIADMATVVRNLQTELHKDGLLGSSATNTVDSAVSDLTADMTGEGDVVMFRPDHLKSGPALGNLPVSLMWQIGDASSADAHLDDLA